MKAINFGKLQAGELVQVPRTQFAPQRYGWNGWLFSEAVVYPQGRAKHGNDRKGDKSNVRYATIGFIAEYGTSSKQARPYMTAANEKAHEKVTEAQRQIWESETGQ